MNRLYCAGKFNFDYLEKDYKSKAAEDYRAVILEDVDLLLKKHTFVPLSTNLQYIGPFYFEADDMDSNTIVSEEIKMINACTHAIFLLDDADCPGTISELILAGSLGKNIGIFYIRHSSNEETVAFLLRRLRIKRNGMHRLFAFQINVPALAYRIPSPRKIPKIIPYLWSCRCGKPAPGRTGSCRRRSR